MQKSTLPKTLRAIAAAIESLDDRQIDALIAGRGKLVLVSTETTKDEDERLPVAISPLIERLNQCNSREEAHQLLAEMNRASLADLARQMKIHVVKQDRREDIENKVVEFGIGRRLRSEAIQSLNLKGGGTAPPNSEGPVSDGV